MPQLVRVEAAGPTLPTAGEHVAAEVPHPQDTTAWSREQQIVRCSSFGEEREFSGDEPRQWHGPGRMGLGCAPHQPAIDLRDRGDDVDPAPVKIYFVDPQCSDLAPAQTGVGEHADERRVPAALLRHTDGTITRLSDDRLQHIAADQRRAYREHLRRGSGFGQQHRDRLRELQRSESPHRNQSGGYWIAEADPAAADELNIRSFPRDSVRWVVLATDGIQKHMDRLGGGWHEIAAQDDQQLVDLLCTAQQWETDTDPDGIELPRSKRHDDKIVLVWRA